MEKANDFFCTLWQLRRDFPVDIYRFMTNLNAYFVDGVASVAKLVCFCVGGRHQEHPT